MAKFVFKLRPVLELREREERALQRELGEVERARNSLEEALRACHAELSGAKSDLRERLGADGSGRILAADVRLGAASSLAAMARAQRVAVELAGVMKRAEAARARVAAAAARRKAVELLRDRALERFRLDAARAEARETDEIVVAAAARAEKWP